MGTPLTGPARSRPGQRPVPERVSPSRRTQDSVESAAAAPPHLPAQNHQFLSTRARTLAHVLSRQIGRSSDAPDKLQRVTGCGVEKDPTLRLPNRR